MEHLNSLIPPNLKQSISDSTPENLTLTCDSLLDFFRPLPQFCRVIHDLTEPAAALCRKSTEASLESKRRGNEAFSKREYAEALSFYSQALRHAPMKHEEAELRLVVTLFVNRASAMHKMGLFEECLRDCNRAIILSPVYAKAWYRRGMANASLKNYRAAVCDLEVSMVMEVSSSGRKHVKEEIETLTCHLNSANEASNSSFSGESMKLTFLAEPDNIILKCVATPSKGRGMTSPNDISPSSLLHCEEPLAAVRVGQAIYSTGSLFNHSCVPNIHAYFLSRRLLLRSTEFVQAWHPLELSYGPQAGQLDLQDRQELLKEQYSFECRCTSCSELNLSDLVINAFRCVQPNCIGAVLETTYYKKFEDAFVLVSGASFSCKLRLPVSKEKKDIGKVAFMLLLKTSAMRHFTPGYCLSCGTNLDLKGSSVASKSVLMDFERLKGSVVTDPDNLISDVWKYLDQLRRVRHPYSKVVAQAEDSFAEFFVTIREFEHAMQHCIESIEILEKLYRPNHIVIGHELMKLASIQLALGDGTTALDNIQRLQAIFALYYGAHAAELFPYIEDLKRDATNLSC